MTKSHLLDVYKRLPLTIVRGAGSWVEDVEGRRYLDMYGGHAVAATGHAHPRLVAALKAQVEKLLFYSNVVHVEHQEEAAALLVSLLPPAMADAKVFFCNSGAEAVENALKIARLATGRAKVVSCTGGFHGRTLGALSATGIAKYRASAGIEIPGNVFVPFADIAAAAAALSGGDVAAFLLEPVQSLAGVRTAPAAYFQELRRLCDAHGTKLVYDELQTGVGRTGSPYFAPRHGVYPDLMTLGKGLGSGLPVAATVASGPVAAGVKPGACGTTFGGGPLACLAVKTTLEILKDEDLSANARAVGHQLVAGVAKAAGVKAVRGEGLLIGIETVRPAAVLQQRLLDAQVLTGTSDDPNVLRLMPPLTLSAAEAEVFLTRFLPAAEAAHG